MSKISNRPDDATLDLLRKTADSDLNVAMAAQQEFAQALQTPLRQGILVGDVVRGLYEAMPVEPGGTTDIPLDLLAPGTEMDYVAYTCPNQGRIPQRTVEGDYLRIPTYRIANNIDWLLRFASSASWGVVQRAMRVLEAGFVKKINDDGFHTLLAAAVDRNILVYDSDANGSQLTKRLVSLMKTTMVRNGGGNTASVGRRKLTDVIMSPECVEGIRNWGIDQIDEFTRREIYVAGDGSDTLMRVFGVNIHELIEFGEGQEYQNFFTSQLAASLNTSDNELILGLDMSAGDSFVMPIEQEVQVFPDAYLHREGREGYYANAQLGFAVLDGRSVILGSC